MFSAKISGSRKSNLFGLLILLALSVALAAFAFGQDNLPDKYRGKAHGDEKFKPKVEMTKYVIAFLRRGPEWTAEQTEETKKLSDGHMKNIERLAEEGKMVLSGPFLDAAKQGDLAGLFIFRTESVDTAKVWSETDPAVQAARFTMEYHPWYGPTTLSY